MKSVLRYLRIACSATCLVACVLLIVLWVRSYWTWDILSYSPYIDVDSNADEEEREVYFESWRGVCSVYTDELGEWEPAPFFERWEHTIKAPPVWLPQKQWSLQFSKPGTRHECKVPHWFAVVLFTILATLPWVRWRFTLRTLLIATTLVAVVLGLVVYAARSGQ